MKAHSFIASTDTLHYGALLSCAAADGLDTGGLRPDARLLIGRSPLPGNGFRRRDREYEAFMASVRLSVFFPGTGDASLPHMPGASVRVLCKPDRRCYSLPNCKRIGSGNLEQRNPL